MSAGVDVFLLGIENWRSKKRQKQRARNLPERHAGQSLPWRSKVFLSEQNKKKKNIESVEAASKWQNRRTRSDKKLSQS